MKAAMAAEPPEGRLQAEQAAERRGHPDRAVGVRAERQRHHAGGDRGARAARRAAGHARRVMRIARRAVMHILAGEVIGVFAHVERADEDRRSEEHTSELQSLMRNSYAVFVLKKKNKKIT